MKTLSIPEFALVVLIGSSGAGRSTFAARHFLPTEVISSSQCRRLVADDEEDFSAAGAALELLGLLAEKRLQHRRLTVIDASGCDPDHRRGLVRIARRNHALPVAIVLDHDEPLSQGRLQQEGFRRIHRLESVEEIDSSRIQRQPLRPDRRNDTGPFDIIGDVHGCVDELEALLAKLGYQVAFSGSGVDRGCRVTPPPGRKAVFVGDLVDRGPRIMDVLRLVMSMVADGTALCVMGNHDDKFLRWLKGRNVKIGHGLGETIHQFEAEPASLQERVREFLQSLDSHYWLDRGRLCVAHAGLKKEMIGRASGAVRAFALYGETTGETDELGFPVRHDWATEYRGETRVVYGHTPVAEARWLNNTLCLDTGCVFGGTLTALRYPEDELVSVHARETYVEPAEHRPGSVEGPSS